jgi:hypothetical protein
LSKTRQSTELVNLNNAEETKIFHDAPIVLVPFESLVGLVQ